jgi:hypothetical protein
LDYALAEKGLILQEVGLDAPHDTAIRESGFFDANSCSHLAGSFAYFACSSR